MPLISPLDLKEEEVTIHLEELKPLTSINEDKQQEIDERSKEDLIKVIIAIRILRASVLEDSQPSILAVLMLMTSAHALQERTHIKDITVKEDKNNIAHLQLKPQIELRIQIPTTHSTLYSRPSTGSPSEPPATPTEETTKSRSCLSRCTIL